MLVGQKRAQSCKARKEDLDKIEKELQNDMNYLNVFVQPIQAINIFQQDRQKTNEV